MPHIGLDFNGSSDYVDCGTDTSLDITDAITLEAWIKLDVLGTESTILSKITSDISGYSLVVSGSTNKIILRINELTPEHLQSDTVLVAEKWYHVVGTWDGSDFRIYLNGGTDGNTTTTGTHVASATLFSIGSYRGTGNWFNGKIDDVRIWNRALSLEEITDCYIGTAPRNGLVAEWLMNEGSGSTIYDTSVNSNNGTITGATWGNNLNHNPLIINVQMTEAEITRDVYITGFHWTGVSNGDLCSVKDNCATPKQIWKAEASADGLNVSFKPCRPIPANGIFVDDLDGGTLLIDLKSSYE